MVFEIDRDRINDVAALDYLCFKEPWDDAEWTRVLENPFARIKGIDDGNGSLAAFCCYVCIFDECEIWKICVREDFRRQGLAGRLLEDMIKDVSAEEPANVYLEVRAGNVAAVNFYEKAGFSRIGRRNGYYGDGEDAFVYVLKTGLKQV